MRGIIACEESQEVTKQFRAKGHRFYSNDILSCSGGFPEWHIKEDFFCVMAKEIDNIEFLGGHPPCTFLANSGVRWLYNKDKTKNEQRWNEMRRAAIFFKAMWERIKYVGKGYLENPIMHKHAMEIIGIKPTQIIHPWQFGHGEQKATCLWLYNLPELKPTNIVEGREQRIWKMSPGENRSKERSKTYSGIAKAMAEQWG